MDKIKILLNANFINREENPYYEETYINIRKASNSKIQALKSSTNGDLTYFLTKETILMLKELKKLSNRRKLNKDDLVMIDAFLVLARELRNFHKQYVKSKKNYNLQMVDNFKLKSIEIDGTKINSIIDILAYVHKKYYEPIVLKNMIQRDIEDIEPIHRKSLILLNKILESGIELICNGRKNYIRGVFKKDGDILHILRHNETIILNKEFQRLEIVDNKYRVINKDSKIFIKATTLRNNNFIGKPSSKNRYYFEGNLYTMKEIMKKLKDEYGYKTFFTTKHGTLKMYEKLNQIDYLTLFNSVNTKKDFFDRNHINFKEYSRDELLKNPIRVENHRGDDYIRFFTTRHTKVTSTLIEETLRIRIKTIFIGERDMRPIYEEKNNIAVYRNISGKWVQKKDPIKAIRKIAVVSSSLIDEEDFTLYSTTRKIKKINDKGFSEKSYPLMIFRMMVDPNFETFLDQYEASNLEKLFIFGMTTKELCLSLFGYFDTSANNFYKMIGINRLIHKTLEPHNYKMTNILSVLRVLYGQYHNSKMLFYASTSPASGINAQLIESNLNAKKLNNYLDKVIKHNDYFLNNINIKEIQEILKNNDNVIPDLTKRWLKDQTQNGYSHLVNRFTVLRYNSIPKRTIIYNLMKYGNGESNDKHMVMEFITLLRNEKRTARQIVKLLSDEGLLSKEESFSIKEYQAMHNFYRKANILDKKEAHKTHEDLLIIGDKLRKRFVSAAANLVVEKGRRDNALEVYDRVIEGFEQKIVLTQKRIDELTEKYTFENDLYKIVIPVNKNQLEFEGSCLNHCVSSHHNNHYEGHSDILLIRNKKDLSVPFYTMCVIGNRIDDIASKRNISPEVDFINGPSVIEFIEVFKKEKKLKSSERYGNHYGPTKVTERDLVIIE